MENTSVEHSFIEIGEVTLHVAQAGPVDGQPVILLHGFPEFWYGWRRQIPVLADAGYRLIVPDQRGYNLSEKPPGIDAYRLDRLAADVDHLADALHLDAYSLVGHDWGAVAAWEAARRTPDRIQRLAILNVPHPAVMYRYVRRHLHQLVKSWYILFFQLPRLPEWWFLRGGGRWMLKASSAPETFSEADVAAYQRAWEQPGAVTAMLNWYRASLRATSPPTGLGPRIHVPTLMIWGRDDAALSEGMAPPSIDLCDEGELVFIDGGTHWVQHTAADRVNELLLGWLGG